MGHTDAVRIARQIPASRSPRAGRPTAAPAFRAALVAVLAAMVGCLPVEAERPECFDDEPCPAGGLCVDGRCVAPPARALTVVLDGCLGVAGSACRAELEPRLAVDAAGARACLVVGDTALSVRWDPSTGLHPAGAAGAGIRLALPPDGSHPAGLYFLAADAACDPGLLLADGCNGDLGCLFALRRSDWAPGEADPMVLGFAEGGCRAAWGADAPIERCDGRDEDCDGEADQTFPVGAECTVGRGGCARVGMWRCAVDGRTATCDGRPGQPEPETADGVDEDCDATIDEGLPGCMLEASRPCGTDDGVCTVGTQRCNPDGTFSGCLDPMGAPLPTPGSRSEVCDDRDDDCDGRVDEGVVIVGDGPDRPVLAVGDPCPLTATCGVMGVVACDPQGAPLCAPGLDSPPPERCTGVDDDCDGAVDEGFGDLGLPCAAGIGACRVEGTQVCAADGGSTVCDAVPGEGGVERCDNPIDDDCDGAVDEDFPELDTPCVEGVGACRVEGLVVCDLESPTETMCGVVSIEPTVELCNGLDDDCNGRIDEPFDLDRDADNCGRCGRVCSGENATPYCEGGFCRLDCDPGWFDGDGLTENGCECNAQQLDRPDPEAVAPGEAVDVDCDGIDGELGEAIFVSPAGADGGDGSAASPLRSLPAAVARAAGQRTPIYMDVGRYELLESVVVPAGVDIHGGYEFDPEGGLWAATRAPRDQAVTLITGPPRPLIYAGLDRPTLLDRVVVEAGTVDGQSSVAVSAVDVGDHLFVRDAVLRAGPGGAGRRGSAGGDAADTAEAGGAGYTGSTAVCPGCGGAGGINPGCPTAGGMGGAGGGRDVLDEEPRPAADGIPGSGPAGADDGGPGGPGGPALTEDGGPGQPGGQGAHGANGEPDVGWGRVVSGNWVPSQSASGFEGSWGSGGGGGGGGMWSGDRLTYGGGGGGGGAGGSAGGAGGPATGGGASVALLVSGGRVTLHGARLEPAAGGTGGVGGSGGLGGPGAAGGKAAK